MELLFFLLNNMCRTPLWTEYNRKLHTAAKWQVKANETIDIKCSRVAEVTFCWNKINYNNLSTPHIATQPRRLLEKPSKLKILYTFWVSRNFREFFNKEIVNQGFFSMVVRSSIHDIMRKSHLQCRGQWTKLHCSLLGLCIWKEAIKLTQTNFDN